MIASYIQAVTLLCCVSYADFVSWARVLFQAILHISVKPHTSRCHGQVAFAGHSFYHATKWGIEGFVESVAQEVAPFGIGMTIVELGGTRTEFRYGSAQVAQLLPVYDQTPAHSFLSMLDPKNCLAPGDQARMAARIIERVDVEPTPLRMVLGLQALEGTLATLRKRIKGFEAQRDLAASIDFPAGE